eukprot:scaffold281400_cov18-Tisochrysis_lutea.AAC.1
MPPSWLAGRVMGMSLKRLLLLVVVRCTPSPNQTFSLRVANIVSNMQLGACSLEAAAAAAPYMTGQSIAEI